MKKKEEFKVLVIPEQSKDMEKLLNSGWRIAQTNIFKTGVVYILVKE